MQANYAGKCKAHPDEHSWDAGDEVFYDKTTKVICNDGKCFKEQKESGGSGGVKTPVVPVRNLETRTKDARDQLEMIWPMCLQKANGFFHPDYDIQKASTGVLADPHFKDIIILAQCLFKGLSMGWSRP